MATESTSPETGIDSELAAFAAILDPPKAGKPEPREEADAEEEEPAEDIEAESQQDDESEATEDDDESEKPETVKLDEIEFNGKRIRLPRAAVEEVQAYAKSLQGDYTRKTMEAAEIRKTAEHQLAQYAQGMQLVQRALQTFGPQPPDPSLLNDDPIEYMRQKEAYGANAEKLQAVNAEMARLDQVRQATAERDAQEHRARELQRLPELIPTWKDAKKASEDQTLIKTMLRERGFDDSDIQHISLNASADHIALLQEWATLKRLFSERQKAKPEPPKVAPAGHVKQSSESSRTQKARDAFKRSRGTDMAAADALFANYLSKK